MSNGKRAKRSHPWEWTDPSPHCAYPSERKCRVHSSMSPNTEKRCRSSDRVILLGILPINTTRRSSCGQGCPIHEQDLSHRAPPLHGHPPHCASARASQQCCWPGYAPVAFSSDRGAVDPQISSPRFPALHHSLLHVPSGGSSAFGSGPVHHNCICQGRNQTHELRNHGGVRRLIPNTREILKEWVHPSSTGVWEMS